MSAIASQTVEPLLLGVTPGTLLEGAALILGLVNGLFLLKFYVRDRARLHVEAIHPAGYQWWFRLPDTERDGVKTRRFGFLLYLAFRNAGLRPTTINKWRFQVRGAKGQQELHPLSISEPCVDIGGHLKVYPVLGARGQIFEGNTRLESGGVASGMAFYTWECWGDAGFDPESIDGVITGRVLARDVFGNRASCSVTCTEKPLEEIEDMVPGISTIGLSA